MSSSNFSGILQITNLNDFISPGQECLKPIESSSLNDGSKKKIENEADSLPIETLADLAVKRTKVEISLDDCLACSGCITTAETVLLNQQSHTEVKRVLDENNDAEEMGKNKKFIVLTLSTQPVASIAQNLKLSIEETAGKIASFFKRNGVHAVFTTTVADKLALCESSEEFLTKYNEKKEKFSPIFASACPGWICYAEKTHNFVLPFISTTKSAQQIMGSLIKDYFANSKHISPGDIYHISLMPCFDKKLEATRSDFYNDKIKFKDVDCVITPVEVQQLLYSEGADLLNENVITLDTLDELDYMSSRIFAQEGSTSGGYAYNILSEAIREFKIPVDNINFERVRKSDIHECKLQTGDRSLNVAIVNGFSNIQNIVRNMKRNKLQYDYIEIMACPSGCINGGAQLRSENNINDREFINSLNNSYYELARESVNYSSKQQHGHVEYINHLYNVWLGGRNSEKTKSLLHTTYHAIKKNNFSIDLKW